MGNELSAPKSGHIVLQQTVPLSILRAQRCPPALCQAQLTPKHPLLGGGHHKAAQPRLLALLMPHHRTLCTQSHREGMTGVHPPRSDDSLSIRQQLGSHLYLVPRE